MSTDLTTKNQNALTTDFGQDATKYLRAGKSANTKRTYKAQWADFERFCETVNAKPLPADVAVIGRYFTALADAGASLSKIRTAKAAIAFAHKAANHPDPTQAQNVSLLLSGIARLIGKPASKKKPVLRDDLRAMVSRLPQTAKGKRDKAIVLVGFAGAFRRSELAGLDMAYVDFEKDQVIVTLPKSKTDQTGEGKKKHLPRLANDGLLCPYRALQDWLDVAGITSGPVFRPMDRHGNVGNTAISDKLVARLVKSLAQRAGLDARKFAGHSLRSGYITQGSIDGQADGDMAQQTGQTTQTLQNYKQNAGVAATRATRAILGDSR